MGGRGSRGCFGLPLLSWTRVWGPCSSRPKQVSFLYIITEQCVELCSVLNLNRPIPSILSRNFGRITSSSYCEHLDSISSWSSKYMWCEYQHCAVNDVRQRGSEMKTSWINLPPMQRFGHRLNIELDLLSFFGLQVHSCTHWLTPRTPPPPPPPRIWAHIRGRY